MSRMRALVRAGMSTKPKPTLKLDWCSHAAAKYAVEKWHYSRRMPVGRLSLVGAWEDGAFIGVVMFGRGANRNAGKPYGSLLCTELAELVRVALTSTHEASVSRIVSIAVRLLRCKSPGIRLLSSYADPKQGHHGGIYQAMGWTYVGRSDPQADVHGTHKRSLSARYGSIAGAAYTKTTPKHKYLYPLDAEMRARIAPLAKPYPKRAGSIAANAPADRAGEGGSAPTPALQL